jgi:hypothetical protein
MLVVSCTPRATRLLGTSFQRAFKYRDESKVNGGAVRGLHDCKKRLRGSAFIGSMIIR